MSDDLAGEHVDDRDEIPERVADAAIGDIPRPRLVGAFGGDLRLRRRGLAGASLEAAHERRLSQDPQDRRLRHERLVRARQVVGELAVRLVGVGRVTGRRDDGGPFLDGDLVRSCLRDRRDVGDIGDREAVGIPTRDPTVEAACFEHQDLACTHDRETGVFGLGDGADERELDLRRKTRPAEGTRQAQPDFFRSRVFSIETSLKASSRRATSSFKASFS